MAFDPDAYLNTPTSSSGFDPDAYLNQGQPSNTTIEAIAQPFRSAGNSLFSMIPQGQNIGTALASRPELQPYGTGQPSQPSSVIGSALQAAGQTLSVPIRMGATLAAGPSAVGQAASDIGNETGHPLVGAGIGTAIQMAPYVAGGIGAYKGINAIDNPVVKGLVNTPQELGPQYHALDEQAGVGEDLPVQRGTIAKFPGLDGNPQNQPPEQAPNIAPISYPKDTKTYLNFVRNRLDSMGQNMTPQELADHNTLLDDIMTAMKAKGQAHTKIFAKAAQAGSDITDLQNQNVPGRTDLNTAYGISKGQQGISNALTNYGKKAIQWGGPAIGGLSALYEYLKK
jgi:hypothetical protein